MAQVVIVYATDYGNTKKMAEAVAAGVREAGATALVKTAEEAKPEDLTSSDGVIIGSPVHMGSMDWRVKKFIDTVCSGLWMQDALNGRPAGVFSTGGGYGSAGGGTELAMLSICNNLAELGLLIVPLPKKTASYHKGGLQWGPYGRSASETMEHVGVSDEALAVATAHGRHIARAAALLKGNKIFADE